ncbi:hypothetical protein GCK72_000173 [Caenorhabditis remanei]|uniref:U1 small nuclear ribonucleoprotein C n=1 Tax=Caenorhabditis remanei TaxID=31234 RepID=A0A6A5HMG8_CAERE|nr:hypothetical protein GCK72_000173 [Caenorhabditis remanei]KAF1768361.1 hypothetical protein GCK72_000173 [Caenorhabditis remanei]
MPKYYCDYCDAFLTHDSLKGRKTHNEGRKHKDAVRGFYQKWLEAQAQKMVDQTAQAFQQNRMHGAIPRTTLGMPPPPLMMCPTMMMGGAPMPPPIYGYPGGPPPMIAPSGQNSGALPPHHPHQSRFNPY